MSEGGRKGAGKGRGRREHEGNWGESWREGMVLGRSNNKGGSNGKVRSREAIS